MPETGNKIEAAFDLVDETFDVAQSESYHLSIQTGPGGLSFCVLNTVIDKYVVLRHYPISSESHSIFLSGCENVFENDDLLRLKYKGCSHLWISQRCTLIPDYLFDQSHATAYLNFNHGWKAGESIIHNYIRSAKMYNVFSFPEALITLLQLRQPGITFFHHATPFIDSAVSGTLAKARSYAEIFYYAGYLDVSVVKNEKMIFYNTFHIAAPEDVIYYYAGVLNLFDMDVVKTKLYYAGTLKDIMPEIKIIAEYVECIIERKPVVKATYSHYMVEQLRSHFIHLFNLYGCVS